MHELEETQVERQFLLGNASMRTQPTTQQRPKPFHGVHMHFTKTVTIFISGIFAPAMIDALMCITPSLETRINAVLICVNLMFKGLLDLSDDFSDPQALHTRTHRAQGPGK
jgi:hypothetical protein